MDVLWPLWRRIPLPTMPTGANKGLQGAPKTYKVTNRRSKRRTPAGLRCRAAAQQQQQEAVSSPAAAPADVDSNDETAALKRRLDAATSIIDALQRSEAAALQQVARLRQQKADSERAVARLTCELQEMARGVDACKAREAKFEEVVDGLVAKVGVMFLQAKAKDAQILWLHSELSAAAGAPLSSSCALLPSAHGTSSSVRHARCLSASGSGSNLAARGTSSGADARQFVVTPLFGFGINRMVSRRSSLLDGSNLAPSAAAIEDSGSQAVTAQPAATEAQEPTVAQDEHDNDGQQPGCPVMAALLACRLEEAYRRIKASLLLAAAAAAPPAAGSDAACSQLPDSPRKPSAASKAQPSGGLVKQLQQQFEGRSDTARGAAVQHSGGDSSNSCVCMRVSGGGRPVLRSPLCALISERCYAQGAHPLAGSAVQHSSPFLRALQCAGDTAAASTAAELARIVGSMQQQHQQQQQQGTATSQHLTLAQPYVDPLRRWAGKQPLPTVSTCTWTSSSSTSSSSTSSSTRSSSSPVLAVLHRLQQQLK